MNAAPYGKRLMYENAWFFGCFALFLIAGAILLSQIQTGDAIFYLNARRTAAADVFFKYFTRMGEGGLFLLTALIFLFVRYRTALWAPLLGLMVMLIAFASKAIFAQPRPWRYFQDMQMSDQLQLIEGVRVYGGYTSFPSGHTMAAFALYTFVALILPQKRAVAVLLFITALLVGVSRIYLVQHFFKDVYAGAIVGVLLAVLAHYLHQRFPQRAWAERSLRRKTTPVV